MHYQITSTVIGKRCEQCGDVIQFPAFSVYDLAFCTIQCAFDHTETHSDFYRFDSPHVMIHDPCDSVQQCAT
jgi:hypothetical protein